MPSTGSGQRHPRALMNQPVQGQFSGAEGAKGPDRAGG